MRGQTREKSRTRMSSSSPYSTISLRTFRPDDAKATADIYAKNVLESTATFEEVPPTEGEMKRRAEKAMASGFPYVVAVQKQVDKEEVVGYAYVGVYRPRSAYRFTVESSVYVAHDKGGLGIGRRLMSEIVRRCREELKGVRTILAVITVDPAVGLESTPSVLFHRKIGFVDGGLLTNVGFKFGKWLDTMLMTFDLGEDGKDAGERKG